MNSGTIRVLLAEDNPADVELVREALDSEEFEYELEVKRDGEQMLRFIEQIDNSEEKCPSIFLLDLNLPRTSGEVLLARVRRSKCCRVPVLIVTSSDSKRDREMTKQLGASGYFRKPSDYEGFMKLGRVVRDMVAPPLA